jgi:Gpi18-like mannosyltransferase
MATTLQMKPKALNSTNNNWKLEPTAFELVLLVIVIGSTFVFSVLMFRPFLTVVTNSGDNGAFIADAAAIHHWDFHGVAIKAFWGLPYVMALVSVLTRISELASLLVVSWTSGLVVAFFAQRLWGGFVAGFFLILNFAWMQRMYLGGTESLFMALICVAFYAARRDRVYLATILASLATTVRPVGIFVLLGIGAALVLQRRFKECVFATLIGLAIGILYIVPIGIIYGNPFANVNSYQTYDWAGGRLLSWPFAALGQSILHSDVPWTNSVLIIVWVLFIALGFVAILMAEPAKFIWRKYPWEMIFAVIYISFLFTYNSPVWARAEFPRFSIPAVPLVLVALHNWLPKDRRILWGIGIVCAFLAACSAVGIRTAFPHLPLGHQ